MAKKPKKADDEAPEGAAEGAAPKKKLPIKLIAIAGVAVLALGGGGAFFLLKGKKDDKAEAAKPVAKPVFFHDVPDITVNLAGTGGRTQYLRVKITLEMAEQATVEKIKPVMPRITDAFQVHLREMRHTDLEGSAGIYRLREELTKRVNTAIAPSRIDAVLFKEIVVQ